MLLWGTGYFFVFLHPDLLCSCWYKLSSTTILQLFYNCNFNICLQTLLVIKTILLLMPALCECRIFQSSKQSCLFTSLVWLCVCVCMCVCMCCLLIVLFVASLLLVWKLDNLLLHVWSLTSGTGNWGIISNGYLPFLFKANNDVHSSWTRPLINHCSYAGWSPSFTTSEA